MDRDNNVDIEDNIDGQENNEAPVVRLDFDKIFKMAEDPDLEDLLRSPLDEALINLETGKEIKQISAIHSFPDILDSSDGEECLQKMLPAIQECLKNDKSNLDLHCEAAVIYKSVIQNEKLVKKFSGLIDTILDNILQNIQNQKEHLSATAWLETIVDIADRLSVSSIKQFVIPVLQHQADPVQRVQRRIIATKMINKLGAILPENEIRKEICPIVATLCKDANSNVRVAIAQKLALVAKALKNPRDVVSCLLPCYMQLLPDEEINVKEAAMNSLTESLSLFTKDAKKHALFSTIKKLTEQSLEKKDESLIAIMRNFGKWCWELNDILDQLDKSWMLNAYCKIVNISNEKCEGGDRNIRMVLKRACVFNLPCMMMMFKKRVDRLAPFVEMFCTDPDEDVRMSIAASYHEILTLFPDMSELIPPFTELLHSGSPDVIAKVANNMTQILPTLYENVKKNSNKTSTKHLDRLVLGCNAILRNTSTWRSHDSLLRSIRILPNLVSQDVITDTFVPLLKNEILQVRAIPCRITASESLLLLMKTISSKESRDEIIRFFKKDLSTHKCCYRRIVYLDVAEMVLNIFSKRIFIGNFLDDVIRLTSDPVSNIRIRAIRFLPKIKTKLQLPEDNETLLKIEQAVKDMLKSDLNDCTRNLVNQAAVELSRCETCSTSDKSDIAKVKEEDERWSKNMESSVTVIRKGIKTKKSMEKNGDDEEEEEVWRPSGLRTPSTSYKSAPWRTERKAIAVVRPQPVITVRSQSPAPMSYRSPSPAPKDTSRPSRLPLSCAAMERDKLRKAATETPPPPVRASRSSSVNPNRRSDAMTSSTSSIESTSSLPPANTGFGLRRSATSSNTFGGVSSVSSSSYSLMHTRSTSNLRRPTYGLSHVQTSTKFERKPSLVSLRVRNLES
ncbi:unnamed protein product [Caenorhabditis bovis]|uniref:Uncharacterized protein n=1 Tax=Caenorhabditis bovis TaxID=2654633 RepID=A0A8S1ESR0_9PELO|nr:unnamed protein product [Caenorhabditis bovis]